jgi:DNA segregation ATPase FtsK/SpoIIIE-like protein
LLVFPDERDVTEVLDDLIDEMEERYRQMQAAKVDDLAELVRRRIDHCHASSLSVTSMPIW